MESRVEKIANCDKPERIGDVIFVHGLDGDAKTTWHYPKNPDAFWPGWLGKDIPQVGVWSLGYPASALAWKGHTMPLVDRATSTLDLLDLDGLGQKPLIFVCHSLGGLLVKQMLRHANDESNSAIHMFARNTKAIVFLSTPHSGADMASWLKHVSGLLRTTVTVAELEAHHPQLRDLNLWYRNHVAKLGITTFVYCEKMQTNGILVVNETTADPGIVGVRPVPLDENHISICKASDRQSQVYRRTKRIIEEQFGVPH